MGIYEAIPQLGGDGAVSSVNGQTGVVTLPIDSTRQTAWLSVSRSLNGRFFIGTDNQGKTFLNPDTMLLDEINADVESKRKVHVHQAQLNLATTIYGYDSDGQSLSTGHSGDGAAVVLNTTPSTTHLMLTPGGLLGTVLTSAFDNIVPTGFTPLTEEARLLGTTNYGETPITTVCNKLVKRCADINVTGLVLAAQVTGISGTSITQLIPGSSSGVTGVKRTMRFYHYLNHYAKALGKNGHSLFKSWTQGETDILNNMTKDVYLGHLRTLLRTYHSHIARLSSQNFRPPLIIMQCTNSGNYNRPINNVALAQLQFAFENPDVYVAAPYYMMTRQADNLHLSAQGNVLMGYYIALCAFRVIFLKQHWRPLHVERVVFKTGSIDVYFNVPMGSLVFDTTQVGATDNMGFDVYNSAGALQSTFIVGVPVIASTGPAAGKMITLTTSGTLPTGGYLTLGMCRPGTINGDGPNFANGSLKSPRTNIRDQQGDAFTYTTPGTGGQGGGVTQRLDNWACVGQWFA